ncbi:MAG: hypothetical protein QNJ92_09935, partial [Alphaproteobacteria bacterium]|nr:hypothetical protein [Alphaproteobacteria bacterium]
MLWLVVLLMAFVSVPLIAMAAAPSTAPEGFNFPPALDSYGDADMEGIWSRLVHRAAAVPFNLAATAIFILA